MFHLILSAEQEGGQTRCSGGRKWEHSFHLFEAPEAIAVIQQGELSFDLFRRSRFRFIETFFPPPLFAEDKGGRMRLHPLDRPPAGEQQGVAEVHHAGQRHLSLLGIS